MANAVVFHKAQDYHMLGKKKKIIVFIIISFEFRIVLTMDKRKIEPYVYIQITQVLDTRLCLFSSQNLIVQINKHFYI